MLNKNKIKIQILSILNDKEGEEIMFCSKCGSQLPEGALFCQKCGAKLNIQASGSSQTEWTETIRPESSENTRMNGQEKSENQVEEYSKRVQKGIDELKKIPYKKILDKLKEIPNKLKIGIVIGVVVIICACSLLHKPGRSVREAYMEQYSSSITVEDAFDNFFVDGKWSEQKEDGDKYVIYTGKCWYMEEKVNIKIRFRVEDDYFYFISLEMNGVAQSDLISGALFDKVYEAYY